MLVIQTLCNAMDCSLPGSSVHGILQTGILEWLPFPFPGALPDPGIEPGSPALQADSLPSEPPRKCQIVLNYPDESKLITLYGQATQDSCSLAFHTFPA